MTSIRIQSADRAWSADSAQGARVFRIGRDESSDIVTADPTVSRQHAEIRTVVRDGVLDGWEVVDLGSTLGTWVDGRRVERAPLGGTTAVGFGDQGRAFTLTVTVIGAVGAGPASPGAPPAPFTAPAAPPAFAAPPPHGAAAPVGPAVIPAPGPTPTPAFQPMLAQTMITGPGGPASYGFAGPGLLVRRRLGTDLRFPGGVPVRIGRDPGLEVHADDQAVSRLHAVVEPRPDGWWWVDRSTSGSFVEGERVTQVRIDEPLEISLGHPTAGYEIEVVPVVAAGVASAGIARKKRRRTLAVVGGAVGALVLVGGGIGTVAVLTGDGDPPPATAVQPASPAPTTPDRAAALDRAKAAAVLLTAFDAADTPLWSGSGSIISDDGLVLTNAHVGDPNAPGQGSGTDDPAYLTVSLTSGDDDAPAAAAFRATPIVSDGYLDVAVLQIDADEQGNPIEPDDLDLPTPLPIGDSDALRTGDRIVALGYPAIGNVVAQGDRPLTVTEGVVSTFQADPVIGTDRGSIDSDVRLGSGNSGGPSINEAGEIIGLNTRVVTADSMDAGAITQGSALIVPVNLAAEVLRIAESGGDPSYVSPYVEQLPTDPGLTTDAEVTSAGWVVAGEEGQCAGASSPDRPQELGVSPGDTVLAEFVATGVPDGLPFSIDFYDEDGGRIDTLSGSWEFGSDAICIYAPFTVTDELPVVIAVVFLGQDGEFAAENPLVLP